VSRKKNGRDTDPDQAWFEPAAEGTNPEIDAHIAKINADIEKRRASMTPTQPMEWERARVRRFLAAGWKRLAKVQAELIDRLYDQIDGTGDDE